MDRSRDFSTVHGERGPDDRHSAVHYYQDGLPYDAEGLCLDDHPEMTAGGKLGDKKRALFAKKLAVAIKRGKAVVPKPKRQPRLDEDGDEIEGSFIGDDEEGDGEGQGEGEGGDGAGDNEPEVNNVNLEAWARGEQKYRFNEVTQRIAALYKKRVANKQDAIIFLVEERVVSKGNVGAEFRGLLD